MWGIQYAGELGEGKGNKRKMSFRFEKAVTQMHGLWSPFPFPLSSVWYQILRGGWGAETGRKYIPRPVLTCFSSTCILPSLVLKAKVAGFPVVKFLIPLCIPELLVILVYTIKGSNARGLCTYCQVNQGALQLKYYFGQKESKKARKDEKDSNSAAQRKCWNVTQASFFHQFVICMSSSTFFLCLLPHTMHLSFT